MLEMKCTRFAGGHQETGRTGLHFQRACHLGARRQVPPKPGGKAMNAMQQAKPYVPVHAGDTPAVVVEKCKSTALLQIEKYLGSLDIPDDYVAVIGSNEPNVNITTHIRIKRMLHKVKELLLQHDNLNQLEWSADRQTATSPALLAINALIYYHKHWLEDVFHDYRSAQGVADELSNQESGIPKWIVHKLAAVILFNNAYRNCCKSSGKTSEVAVWSGQGLSFARAEVAKAFASTLLGFRLKACADLEIATVAYALCLSACAYEHRYDLPDSYKYEDFVQFTDQVIEEFDSLKQKHKTSSPQDAASAKKLVIFEFRSYLFAKHITAKNVETLLEKIVQEAFAKDQSQAVVYWVSFTRFWAAHHADGLQALLENSTIHFEEIFTEPEFAKPEKTEPAQILMPVLGGHVFRALDLRQHEEAAFQVAFHFGGMKAEPPAQDVWGRLQYVIDGFVETRGIKKPTRAYLPWPYMMRALEILSHVYPKDFFEAQVERQDPASGEKSANRIFLPKNLPNWDEIGQAIARNDWLDAKLIVARCFATLLLNQRMGFGNRNQRITTADDESEKLQGWLEIADKIAEKNQHKVMDRYLQCYLTPPQKPSIEADHHVLRKGMGYILAIDIGGTNIKIAMYEYYPVSDTLAKSAFTFPAFDTTSRVKSVSGDIERKYKTIKEFVDWLDKEIHGEWLKWEKNGSSASDSDTDEQWSKWKSDHLLAVGVTWPGAVSGQAGHEYVSAYSKILNNFDPFDPDNKPFSKATAEEVHALRLREAFSEKYQVPVTLINDGTGHVMYHQGQFHRENLSSGEAHETIVGLFAGTGSAEAVLDAQTGKPLPYLAELGKQIDDIASPFDKSFIAGASNKVFNKDTLSKISVEHLMEFGIKAEELNKNEFFKYDDKGEKIPDVPGLLITWILEESQPNPDQCTQNRQKLEEIWVKERGVICKDSLEDRSKVLSEIIFFHTTAQRFAYEVSKRAGQRLADLIAQVRELFGSLSVFAGGGPLSGIMGTEIRKHARKELEVTYGFDVDESQTFRSKGRGHLNRLIRFPEPNQLLVSPPGPSGCWGAAMATVDLLTQGQKPKPKPQGTPGIAVFTVLELGQRLAGSLACKDNIPQETAGQVRSRLQANGSPRVKQNHKSVFDPLPWPDYGEDCLGTVEEHSRDYCQAPNCCHFMLSAGHVIKEWGCILRVGGKLYQRQDTKNVPVPDDWPVLVCSDQTIAFQAYASVKNNVEPDFISGIPLVIDGKPVSRTFLVANCSDVALNYGIEPEGCGNVPARAWQELNECWQRNKLGEADSPAKKLPDYILEQNIEKLKNRYEGCKPNKLLLHSIIAQAENGDFLCFAISGDDLENIARALQEKFQLRHAILLDSGATLSWHIIDKSVSQPRLLLAGEGHGNKSLAYVVIHVDGTDGVAGVLRSRQHPFLQ